MGYCTPAVTWLWPTITRVLVWNLRRYVTVMSGHTIRNSCEWKWCLVKSDSGHVGTSLCASCCIYYTPENYRSVYRSLWNPGSHSLSFSQLPGRIYDYAHSGIGGVVAACSAYNRKVVASNPGSALLIPEVNVVDIQLRALLGLCSLLVHSAKCAGNRMWGLNE